MGWDPSVLSLFLLVEHKTLEPNGEDYGLGGRQYSRGSASYLLSLYK